MGAPTGTCRLCLRTAELRNSHGPLTAFAFRRSARSNKGRTNQIVRLEDEGCFFSCDNLREHLLCGQCEQRFSTVEKYAAEVSRQEDGSFPALAAARVVPSLEEPYVRSLSTLNCDWLTRFGASLVWRTSVGTRIPVTLSRHEEAFREYLAADDLPFPSDCCLSLTLLQPPEGRPIDQVTSAPSMKRLDAHTRGYTTLVWGLHFTLFTDSCAPYFALTNLPTTQLVLISDGEAPFEHYARMAASAPRRGALAKLAT